MVLLYKGKYSRYSDLRIVIMIYQIFFELSNILVQFMRHDQNTLERTFIITTKMGLKDLSTYILFLELSA